MKNVLAEKGTANHQNGLIDYSADEIAHLFEVEELEERLEAAKWTAEAGYNSSGPYCKISCTF